MENRIHRRNDESLYQPRIHSDRIRELYRLREATGAPMTVLLDLAIKEFVATYGRPGPLVEDPSLPKVEKETWEEICEVRKLLDQVDYLKCLAELEQFKGNGEGRKTD